MLSTAQLSFVSIFPTLYVCYWCFACWLCQLMIKGHEHIQRLLCIFLTLLSSAGCCFIIIITQSKCKAVSSSWQIHPFICMKCHVMECFLCSSFWILLCLITSSREGSGTPTPALLPGKSHGQRSLGGCSQWGREVSDTTERLHFHALEKEMVPHSSVLAWRIPGTGEPGGLPSMGSHRVGHDWSDLAAADHL